MDQRSLTGAAGFTSKSCSDLVVWSGHHYGLAASFLYLSFFFPPLSMRTLFLTHSKSKLSPWRVVLVCCLAVAVMAVVYSAIDDLIGKSESTVVLLCAVLFGGVVALAYRWFQVRRLQSTVRDLKDSALW